MFGQYPGVCYFYVALWGLSQKKAGQRIIRDAVSKQGDDFRVVFSGPPGRWECLVSRSEIDWYWAALEREPDPGLPEWLPALEVGYNKYLAVHEKTSRSGRGYDTPGGSLWVYTTGGGTTGDVLAALGCPRQIHWFVPSQKPRDIHESYGGLDEGDDLPRLCSLVRELLSWNKTLVLAAGTREEVSDNSSGIVSQHAYWLKTLDGEAATLVDLRRGQQRELTVPLAELVRHLWFIDGAVIPEE